MLATLAINLAILLILCTLSLVICWAYDNVGRPVKAEGSARPSRSSLSLLTGGSSPSDFRRRGLQERGGGRGCHDPGSSRDRPGPASAPSFRRDRELGKTIEKGALRAPVRASGSQPDRSSSTAHARASPPVGCSAWLRERLGINTRGSYPESPRTRNARFIEPTESRDRGKRVTDRLEGEADATHREERSMLQRSGLLSVVMAAVCTTAALADEGGARPCDVPGWGRVIDPSRDCDVCA